MCPVRLNEELYPISKRSDRYTGKYQNKFGDRAFKNLCIHMINE